MSRESSTPAAGWLAVALSLWALLTFGHGTGLDIVAVGVDWAQRPGSLSPDGGVTGFVRADHDLTAIFAVLAGALILAFAWRIRRTPPRRLADVLLPWVLWALLTGLVWKYLITYSTELVHFGQYALIATLLGRAWGDRRPQLTFGLGMALGVLDEIWQHYGLHVWLMGEHTHYMDFSDPMLNGLGVCLGLLPAVTRLRLRDDPGDDGPRTGTWTLVIAAAVLLPILLLDPVTISRIFGSYPWYPYWDEHTNHKAVHWLTPTEGVPLLLACLILLDPLVNPRRRGLSQVRLVLLAACAWYVVQPSTRKGGTAVHEAVPTVVAPHTAEPVIVDGDLSDAAWRAAPRLGPFVDNTSATDTLTACDGQGLAPTYAQVAWDDSALYIAYEVTDADIWAPQVPRDHQALLHSEGVRVFVDDGGDEVAFYEFAVSPAGTQSDQFRFMGAAPLDFNPWDQVIALARWDAPEMRSAVHVRGSLDAADSYMASPVSAADSGYTVELALPWSLFRTISTPTGQLDRLSLPPRPGQRWRLGLYRFEHPRLPTPGVDGGTVSRAEAMDFLGIDADALASLLKWGSLTTAEDGSLVNSSVWSRWLNNCAQLQAWSPTYLSVALASRFGVLEFGPDPAAAAP